MFSILLALAAAIIPACADESATDCYWDASTQGNGIGVSFVDINGTAYYTGK